MFRVYFFYLNLILTKGFVIVIYGETKVVIYKVYNFLLKILKI